MTAGESKARVSRLQSEQSTIDAIVAQLHVRPGRSPASAGKSNNGGKNRTALLAGMRYQINGNAGATTAIATTARKDCAPPSGIGPWRARAPPS